MVRAVPALLGILPRLDFAARIQILVNSIPTRVFLSVVVARCQQKTERRDEDASQSEHRGNGLKGRGIIYLKRIHRARVGTVHGSRCRHQPDAAGPISPIGRISPIRGATICTQLRIAKRLQVHPETLQVITSWEIFGHWHLT